MGVASEGVRAHLLSMAKWCVADPHALRIGCFYCFAALDFQAALFAINEGAILSKFGA